MEQRAVLDTLKGGDRRSIGRSNQVVKIVRRRPALFPALIDGMYHEDELVRMRAADAVEKLTVTNPEWLRPFKRRLIGLAACAEQQELRWHLAQMLPRLELSRRDRMVVAAIFRGYLQDQSRIVKTFAMQSLADLAMQDPRLRNSIRPLISSLTKTGSPSMKSRGRKLMLQLAASTSPRHAPVSR
ncbi:MAG: hypothetical protein OEV99_01330 [Nitrospira sp.]|nr:hypothetical protein [Nitrospira sp.]MDH4368456.1 hypothetical protein [Nitrospira sp.]MDH5346560.1 hypothetical protein [Nitrospira sp.]MDH5496152.1 hypothetical protein [Nitrospira sp.]